MANFFGIPKLFDSFNQILEKLVQMLKNDY